MALRIWVPLIGLLFISVSFDTIEAKHIKGYTIYQDPTQPTEDRVEDLLSTMTLEEKFGQMTQLERVNLTAKVMKKYSIGSVLSAGGSTPRTNATAEDWVKMVNKFQKWALSNRLGIPMIYGIDAVHGHNNVYKATVFPHNSGLGATRDPELVKKIGSATALEVRDTGIPYTFAPCIAVLACAKHYVGDGGTNKGINENNTLISWKGLLEIHIPAYVDSIQKGIGTIMVSFSSVNGVKMHVNNHLLTKYLKDALKFKGFIISDYQGIDKITTPMHANYTYSVQASILAGIDMVMVPYNYSEFIGDLAFLVKKNVIPESRINDAVRRILRVKFTMGLFENPLGDLSLAKYLGSQAHRNFAREAVRKSLVLLKNGKKPDTPLLPLPKKMSKILVVGSHANNLGYQCGGWTISWQGQGGNNITIGTTILDGIKSVVEPSTKVIYSEDATSKVLEFKDFSYAIVVVGELPYAETMGDNLNLTIPEPGPSTIKTVCKHIKCVVVLISGRPLVIEHLLYDIDAFVAAWLPGTEGKGVADVIFGDYKFTGRLSQTWFKNVNQLPMNYGDRHYDPLFPLGYGLTTEPIV